MSHLNDALAAVRRTGRAAEHAELVHARASTLVRVDPGPIAVRLPGFTATFRDAVASSAREAGLAAALAGAGAPVLAPLAVLGDGTSLWPWVETGGAGDAASAGRALRACHDALGELPLDREPLWLLQEWIEPSLTQQPHIRCSRRGGSARQPQPPADPAVSDARERRADRRS